MSRQCFILCRDYVAIEGPLSPPRQEVRVAIGAWLRPRNFGSRQKICCVATKQFNVATMLVRLGQFFIATEDF